MDADLLKRLVNEAGFIFRGRVDPQAAPDALSLQADAGETVTVRVEEVLRGMEVMRGLSGTKAIMLTRQATELRELDAAILFTECISLGKQVHLREIGHVDASAETSGQVAEAVHEADLAPLRGRVATAELIITGEVVASREVERPFPPRSEHDPEWWIARIAVASVIKGRRPRGDVEVLFANSKDIVWYKAPKLHPGTSGIFLLHRVEEGDAPKEAVPRSGLKATDPLDFLPADRLGDVERLLGSPTQER